MPVEEEGGLAKTHHEMHYGVVLTQADVWTCTEDEPVLGI